MSTFPQVTVTVPATTANLGPGFDCLGMALNLRNEITFTAVPQPDLTLTISGEGAGVIPDDERNLIVRAAEIIFNEVGKRPSGLHIRQHNRIPVGSGLGSSAAATLGGMIAANALTSGRLPDERILKLATTLEGHPDNVAPALYGGLTLVLDDNDTLHVEKIPVPSLRVVVVLPAFNLLTADARAALPRQVPLADAIFNAGRVGLLLRALAAADMSRLRLAMEDRLHQPYRLPLIPGMADAFAAAQDAGAAGVALSGAGPSLIAVSDKQHDAIRTAVIDAFTNAGLHSRAWILPVDNQGSLTSP